jgi:hypothetical protein
MAIVTLDDLVARGDIEKTLETAWKLWLSNDKDDVYDAVRTAWNLRNEHGVELLLAATGEDLFLDSVSGRALLRVENETERYWFLYTQQPSGAGGENILTLWSDGNSLRLKLADAMKRFPTLNRAGWLEDAPVFFGIRTTPFDARVFGARS